MTPLKAIKSDNNAAVARSFADCLPVISTALASTSRIAFDSRFDSWLAGMLGQSAILAKTEASMSGDMIRLKLQCAHGRLELGVESTAWPALQFVAELADSTLAAAAASIMLRPLIDLFESVLGDVSVVDIQLDTSALEMAACLHTFEHRIAICACEATLAQRLRDVWNAEQRRVNSDFLLRLRLRGRIVLMHRILPVQTLRMLVPGDLILMPESELSAGRPHIVVGCGFTLRAAVLVSFKEHTVHVVDNPILEEEDITVMPIASSASLDELQLPIGFELDTARVSLSELAGMRPGYAIELDMPLAEAMVRLVCHGQIVGHGQLIAIGERIGIRITRMSFDNEQHSVR